MHHTTASNNALSVLDELVEKLNIFWLLIEIFLKNKHVQDTIYMLNIKNSFNKYLNINLFLKKLMTT